MLKVNYLMNRVVLNTIFLLLLATLSWAQDVSVRADINRDKILIGEPIILQLEARMPEGTAFKWFPVDTLTHFEFIEKGKIDSSQPGLYKQSLTITSFDSGYQMIPALALEIGDKYYLTDSLPVSVSFSDFDPKKDYHDIKDIIEVEAPATQYIKWVLLALGLLLIVALLIWYIRKKRNKQPVPISDTVSKLSPLEEALQALKSLKEESLTPKQLHTKMNDILRWFVYRKHGFTSMQKTNGELITQLEKMKMPQHDFIELVQVLRMSDAVKFAKFIPDEKENEHSFQVIKKTVEQLNK